MTLLERLRETEAHMRKNWSVDWNAPSIVLASDGSGEHVAAARHVLTAEFIAESRNALPALLDAVYALDALYEHALRIQEHVPKSEHWYAVRDASAAALAALDTGDVQTSPPKEVSA